MSTDQIITISQLNHYVAQSLSQQFSQLWVQGEISTFTRASSGHCYFSLKDNKATAKAVMFAGQVARLGFLPKIGDQVQAFVNVGLYEPRGDYQLQVQTLRKAGVGNLYEQFLQIRDRLIAQGLCDARRKKPIPPYPQRIGVITSLQAAALHDVLTTLKRRAPHLHIIIYPSAVQGADAPDQLIYALNQANQRAEVDVLLLVRGGGSLEDLWCFNHEGLAHVVAQSRLPIITGVGHETDTTIVDFVSDLRAPTPTAAAELVSQSAYQLRELFANCVYWLPRYMERQLSSLKESYQESNKWLHRLMDQRLQQQMQSYDYLAPRLVSPVQLVQRYQSRCVEQTQRLSLHMRRWLENTENQLSALNLRLHHQQPQPSQWLAGLQPWQQRLHQAMQRQLAHAEKALLTQQQTLRAMNPKAVLQRGYSIVYDEQGKVVSNAQPLQNEQALKIEFSQGVVHVKVTKH